NTPVAEKPTEQASEPTTNAAAETKPEVARTVAATGSLTASRTAPASATGEFSVEVIVKKGSITGFAKLEEIIPSGFVASAASSETNGSAFSFVDGKAKFVWMSIPSSEEFKISYKIKTPDNYIGDCKLEGTFSYIENEETKKAAIAPTITVIGSGGGQAPVAQAEAPKPEVQQQTIAPKPESKPKAETVQAQAPQPKPAKVTKVTSAASGGLVYRVQVCAVHKNVPNSYFNDLFKIQEEVYSETHEGWYKYTTGAYQQYQQARDRRVNLADNGVNTGPFVTAYNNGSRVTVQEALMISRQKWVQ
ncbi:MAG: hypothetical protein IT239_06860, partial [Bacteroidia bacterium]|nr:hypothetical protein [Bacteroidia bacterium]